MFRRKPVRVFAIHRYDGHVNSTYEGAHAMIILGIILLILGYVLPLSILSTIGWILIVIGAVLWLLGAIGRPVAGRRVWF
jgi:hypothetical protein